MKVVKLAKTRGDSYYIKGRNIPKGCKYCIKGSKVVLFLNGICQKPEHCFWYCPISEERRGKEITFADEIEIQCKEDLLKEIQKISAQGMSITGGEPLSELNLEKTIEYIEYAKKEKGKKFHVHLYTNGITFNENIANRLSVAGLDEIRFHPAQEHWKNINWALKKNISVGAEVPVIPGNEYMRNLEEFVYYLDKIGVDFINLNEFEYCFPNSQFLKERGFKLKRNSIAAVINSQESALSLIRKIGMKVNIQMHFCPIRAKDYHQLKNRYIRRAKNIRLPYEVITEEGLLLYAQIEGEKKDLDKFYENVVFNLKIKENQLSREEDHIKMPFYISIEDRIVALIKQYELKGFIIETTPFRRLKYRQITEKTPLEVFKNEYGFNRN
ncbi:MAG: 4Fe-4S cluster-binding domain-containing protein [Candidatus Lokiarchaeia archaeon]|nr:4Fe-4S cluster-binding domain-containing protein [Candidatus Lokiarchaeia archaeon]